MGPERLARFPANSPSAWLTACLLLFLLNLLPQSLANRLKENMEKLTEERDQRAAAENREKEQNKRLQRQLRDTKEEMSELARKEAEASRKKHELVMSCSSWVPGWSTPPHPPGPAQYMPTSPWAVGGISVPKSCYVYTHLTLGLGGGQFSSEDRQESQGWPQKSPSGEAPTQPA